MKKKLLLVLSIVALLVCLFAISVSAENALKPQDNNGYGELSFFDESITVGRTNTKYGFTPYIDAEGTTYARVVVGDGTTFYTFPTAYVLSESTIYGSGSNNIFVYDLTSLNSAMQTATGTNPNWGKTNIYRIEMPTSLTRVNGGGQNFGSFENVIEIRLQPNSAVQDSNKNCIFWCCYALETIHNLDTFVFKNGCLGGSFQNCSSLTSLTIGVSEAVTDTGENVFNGCTNLKSVNFQEAFPNLKTINKYAFKNCTALETFSSNGQQGAYVMPSTLTTINQDAFAGCKAMKYVSIPASVTSIGTTAFADCTSLVFVDFNDNQNEFNVDNWGQFKGCTSLLAVSLPDNYLYIPNRMFTGCSALKSVYLPQNLVRIDTNGWGEDPFNNCRYLYFVQDAFEVVDENGNFYSAETFVQPNKPDVYFMPESLSALCTNKTSGKCFTGSYNLNPTIVFGTNMQKTTVADGIFLECGSNGTLGSGITVVFLGNMEQICINTNSNRAKGIKYVFANEKDVDLTSVNIINNTTNGYNLNDNTEGFYFCKGDCYYLLNGVKYNGTYSDSVLTKVEGAVHFHNPNADAVTEATCTTAESTNTYCFCTEVITSEETAPALGHEAGELTQKYYEAFSDGALNYFKDMITEHDCIRCEEVIMGTEEDTALFTADGYSIPEVGTSDCISHTIKVNKKAIEAYELETGNKVNYGIVAAVKTSVDSPLSYNGETLTAGTYALAGDMTGTEYTKLVIKVSGVQAATDISCNAYVAINKEITYLCGDVASKTALKKQIPAA